MFQCEDSIRYRKPRFLFSIENTGDISRIIEHIDPPLEITRCSTTCTRKISPVTSIECQGFFDTIHTILCSDRIIEFVIRNAILRIFPTRKRRKFVYHFSSYHPSTPRCDRSRWEKYKFISRNFSILKVWDLSISEKAL